MLPPQPPYKLPILEEERLARMSAPPVESELIPGSEIEESDDESPIGGDTPGAFPERTESAYY